jgi:hypothetical protein
LGRHGFVTRSGWYAEIRAQLSVPVATMVHMSELPTVLEVMERLPYSQRRPEIAKRAEELAAGGELSATEDTLWQGAKAHREPPLRMAGVARHTRVPERALVADDPALRRRVPSSHRLSRPGVLPCSARTCCSH